VCDGKVDQAAARALGITRDVLRYRMKKHTIDPPTGV
jgi:DNA-binding NtrC family response regulator